MQWKARLFFVWIIYASLLATGSGAFVGRWQILPLIYFGSLLGMLLPKLISISADMLLAPGLKIDSKCVSLFLRRVWADPSSLIPTTKAGMLVYSYPFLFALGVVALSVVTSGSNWFGKALVLGLVLRLIIDLIMSNRDKGVLRQRWFSAFHARLSDTELDVFVYSSFAVWVLLTIFSFAL